jgi:hypothetical protein
VSEIDRERRLDNPMLVRWEFASEERLATRNAIYRQLLEGDDGEEFLFPAVAEARPGPFRARRANSIFVAEKR